MWLWGYDKGKWYLRSCIHVNGRTYEGSFDFLAGRTNSTVIVDAYLEISYLFYSHSLIFKTPSAKFNFI